MRHLLRFWPLLLPLLILIPALTSFPFPSADAAFSDLALTHYPNAIYLRNFLLQNHVLPFWSPTILSGSPFAADPLSGLWYPLGWPAYFIPLPLGFNLSIFFHLLWGGLGMYFLLQAEGRMRSAALFGAMAFEAMPKLFAHYGAGHLTLLYAIPWTPWLLWASQKARTVEKKKFKYLEAIILALIFLADVRWGVYAGLVWWLYSLVHSRLDNNVHEPQMYLSTLFRLIWQTILAALIIAPLELPLLEFVRLSSRAYLTSTDVFSYSLPPARLLGLVFPDFHGFHEWMLYPGVVILALSMLAISWKTTRKRGMFWIGLLSCSLIFSLGSYIPLLPLAAKLPGLNLLRVPSRALFLTGLSLASLAAYALDHLLVDITPAERRVASLFLVALAGFALTLSTGVWLFTGKLPANFGWGGGLALVSMVWITFYMAGRLSGKVLLVGLLGLCLLDWTVVNRSLFSPHSSSTILAEGQAAAQWLASQPGEFRIYSPSYSLPQQTAEIYGLQLADGVNPMQLRSYVEFMQRASGVPWTGYSVTLPPFARGNPRYDNAAYRPNPGLLGILNVSYVAVEYDLPIDGLKLRQQFGQTRLYENLKVLPRAWVQPIDAEVGQLYRPVENIMWQPDYIQLQVEGPGLLVLSEIDYPGWWVWVDDNKTKIIVVAGLLRGVVLETGTHNVIFAFRPTSVYLGLAIMAMACLFIGYSWLLPHLDKAVKND